jgi:beta-glucuronidase
MSPVGKMVRVAFAALCVFSLGWSGARADSGDSAGATIVLENADHRPAQSLNGAWHFIVDPYLNGLYSFHREELPNGWFANRPATQDDTTPVEYDFARSPTLRVPADWNTQSERLFFYEGPMWYQREFAVTPTPGKRTFLHVGAANYRSKFWVNGRFACAHEGGFTAFDCEVTGLLRPRDNFIVAMVDNTRLADGVPTLKTDWWNYGGLTRDVSLIEVPDSFIDGYDLHLDRTDRATIEGWVHVVGAAPGATVTIDIVEAGVHATASIGEDGRATVRVVPKTLALWSPDSPKLYRVTLRAGADTLDDDIGFRTIEVRGTSIVLNGQPIFLRGISIHAEAPIRTGRANTQKDADTLLGWARQLGCNFVRLAHYPHDERMTRTADRLGLLVWSEIPAYWTIDFADPAVLDKAKRQLKEMIDRDRDKASIILWSVANETPNTPARTQFLSALAGMAHEFDPTRLVTAALLVRAEGNTKIVDDPLGQALDVLGVNEYVGWYEKRPADADDTAWRVDYPKPVIVSEFGGGAKAGLHGPADRRWTEEYQASLYQHQLVMLNRLPNLRGMSPWVLMDFRSPARQLPGIQDYFNRKGLISDQGQKKLAFSVLRKAYTDGSVGKAE